MPIPKQKYKELKAYYDFQRKVSYNKEKLRGAVEVMLEQPDLLFDDIWSKMKEEEMQEVPKDWVPKDDKLKIEGVYNLFPCICNSLTNFIKISYSLTSYLNTKFFNKICRNLTRIKVSNIITVT